MAYYASIPTYIPPVMFSDDSYDFPAYRPGTSQLERSRSNRFVYQDDPWNSARSTGVLVPNPPLVVTRGRRGANDQAQQKPQKLQINIPEALKPGSQPAKSDRPRNDKLARRLTFITNTSGSTNGAGSTIEDVRATIDKTALFARLQLHLGDRSATLTVVSDQLAPPAVATNARNRNPSPRPRGSSDPPINSTPVSAKRQSGYEPTKPHWAPMPVIAPLESDEPEQLQRPLPPFHAQPSPSPAQYQQSPSPASSQTSPSSAPGRPSPSSAQSQPSSFAQFQPSSPPVQVQRPLPPVASGNIWQDMNAALSNAPRGNVWQDMNAALASPPRGNAWQDMNAALSNAAPKGNTWQDMNTAISNNGSRHRRPMSEQFIRQPMYPSIEARLEPSMPRPSFDRARSSERASFDSQRPPAPKERDMDVEDDFVLVEAHWKGPSKRDASPGRHSRNPSRNPSREPSPARPAATREASPMRPSPARRPQSLTPQPRAPEEDFSTQPLRPTARRPATEPLLSAPGRAALAPPAIAIQASTPPFPVLRLNDAPMDAPTPPMPEMDLEASPRGRSPSPAPETVVSHLSFGNLPDIPGSEDTHWHTAPRAERPPLESQFVIDVDGASEAIEAQIQNLYGELLGEANVEDQNGEISQRVVEDSRNVTALILKALRQQAVEDEKEERVRAKGWRNGFGHFRRTTTDP